MMYACGHPYSIPHSSIVQMNLNEPPTNKQTKKGNIYTEFNFRIIMWFFLLYWINTESIWPNAHVSYLLVFGKFSKWISWMVWSLSFCFFSYIFYVWMYTNILSLSYQNILSVWLCVCVIHIVEAEIETILASSFFLFASFKQNIFQNKKMWIAVSGQD